MSRDLDKANKYKGAGSIGRHRPCTTRRGMCNSEIVELCSRAFEGSWTAISLELRRAQVHRSGACAVADGEWCVAPSSSLHRVSRWPQRARGGRGAGAAWASGTGPAMRQAPGR